MRETTGIPRVLTQTVSLGRIDKLTRRVLGFEAEGEVEMLGDGRWRATLADVPGAAVYGSTREIAAQRVPAIALRALADRIDPPAPIPTVGPSPLVSDGVGLPMNPAALEANDVLDELLVEALEQCLVAQNIWGRARALLAALVPQLAVDEICDRRGSAWGIAAVSGREWLCIASNRVDETDARSNRAFDVRVFGGLTLLVDDDRDERTRRLHMLTTALRDDPRAAQWIHPNDDVGDDECEGP